MYIYDEKTIKYDITGQCPIVILNQYDEVVPVSKREVGVPGVFGCLIQNYLFH